MERRRENIAVPDNGTAFLSAYVLNPQIHCRKMIVYEDPTNGAAQGLEIEYINDNYANVHVFAAGEKLELGSQVAEGNGCGRIIGTPGYNSGNGTIPATIVAYIRSHGTATKIRIEEWD